MTEKKENSSNARQSVWPFLCVILLTVSWPFFCYYIAGYMFGPIEQLEEWLCLISLPALIVLSVLLIVPTMLFWSLYYLFYYIRDVEYTSFSQPVGKLQETEQILDPVNEKELEKSSDINEYANSEELRRKIRFTAHSKSVAEKRFRFLDIISHLLLIWLSLSLLSWSIASLVIDDFYVTEKIYASVIGALVLAFSILVFGFRFGETASQHGDCSKRLFELYDSDEDRIKLSEKYQKLLSEYPNHSDFDFSLQIIKRDLKKRKFFEGQKINSMYKISWYDAVIVTLYFIIFTLIFLCFLSLGLKNFLNIFCH